MTLEQLQAMSDNELNELAAVKVMGWIKEDLKSFDRSRYNMPDGSYISCHAWNPCTDMNDCYELLSKFEDFTVSKFRNEIRCEVFNAEAIKRITVIGKSIYRTITIAAILAKEG